MPCMSNTVSPQDVAHVAELANLSVTKEEQEQFAEAFSATVEEINHLHEIDTTDVEPTHQLTGLTNVWREDKVDESRLLTQESALSQAEHSVNGFVVVDRIIEEQ